MKTKNELIRKNIYYSEIPTEQCYHRLENNRKYLERELKPEKSVDDFLECFVISLDEHEEVCQFKGQRKKMAADLFNKILSSVHKGSYYVLLKTLAQTIPEIMMKNILDKIESTSEIQGKNFSFKTFLRCCYIQQLSWPRWSK